MQDNFAVFILSHGRPNKIYTIEALNKSGYTGAWYIVIDNEDKTADEYIKNFGDKVLIFDKQKKSKEFDTADLPSRDRRTVVYARNACFDFAEKLGIDYFLELDDDYTVFSYRFEKQHELKQLPLFQCDRLFSAMLKFLNASNALTVALAQGGDFIGGTNGGNFKKKLLRKAMNTFFCKTTNKFDFVGRINEDVNTYTTCGMRGDLIFTITDAMINQKETQSNSGGMTDIYIDNGTYIKSFYTIMFAPSCVSLMMMGNKYKRIHHRVNWEHCTPKIINEKYKKQ